MTTGIESAGELATQIRAGDVSARSVTEAALERIGRLNPAVNAITAVLAERALRRAAATDASVAARRDPGPLAGVPFAAKNLFDIEGLPTLAGSAINRTRPAAKGDAAAIRRLEAAGAILVGATNMDEYAYGFVGENSHYGPTRNPHAPGRMAGGSSAGSAAAVAAGMVPLALGSDTNGSIRVPAALCGIFGLKPTYGRLSRAGAFPFVASLDHVGPLARSVADLALAFDAMAGFDPDDPVCQDRPAPVLARAAVEGVDGLRIARAAGHFDEGIHPEAAAAVDHACAALDAQRRVVIEGSQEARAAAYLITMAEGGALHLERLRLQHAAFDPDVRDRLLAGAMIPSAWVVRAQRFRAVYRARVAALFQTVDALIAPATPCAAPEIGQKTFALGGREVPVRATLGLYTQPLSFIGLPVIAVPVWLQGAALPVGVQVVAPAWREDIAIRIAADLERRGVAAAPVARL